MNDRQSLTPQDLVRLMIIRVAATDRDPPILRGRAAPRDAWERDRLRREFVEWFVRECVEAAGLVVIDKRRPFDGSDMAGFAWRGTPPQRFAN